MAQNTFPWKNLELQKFRTSDNQTLFYHFQKAKNPIGTIIITLAWNMSPDVCSPLLLTNKKIKKHYNVFIFILRGYKKNSSYGNCISRCAIDLNEFINNFKIDKFIAICHSIGVAMWWQYILMFGQNQIKKFILIDEMSAILQNPINTGIENKEYGSVLILNNLFNDYNILSQENVISIEYRKNKILPQFSNNFKINNPNIMLKIFKKVNYYSLIPTAEILYSNQTNNWINNLLNNKIEIPTYLFCGKNSVVPFTSVIYEKQFFTNSYIHIFEGPSSSHFAWMENYKEFNELINKFIFL